MKKSIFLFFAAILCATSAWGYNLYLYTGTFGSWNDSGATFKVYTTEDIQGTSLGNNWYKFDVGTFTGTAYIKRCSSTGDKWNEFSAFISSSKNVVRAKDWNAGEITYLHIVGDNWNNIGNWVTNNTNGRMTLETGTTTFTKTFTDVSASAHTFKIAFYNTWDGAIAYSNKVSCINGTVVDAGGNDHNIKFTPNNAGDVTITYNMADGKIVITCAEPTYTVTVNNDGNGTTTPSGVKNSITQTKGLEIDATPATNYEFVNWTIVSGDGTFASDAKTVKNTFYPTSDATIQANFRSTITHSLTVSNGANIESVTGSVDPVTLGSSYSITATPKTGYKFDIWTADPVANATFDDDASANTNVTVLNGSVTVTASATEIMSTLTTANTYDKGTPTIAKPTTSATEIGIATAATVTAATNEDYVVASWTLENCVRTDGGADNATTITVKSNGDGAAATVTANYEMIKYYIAGSLPAITWTPGNHALTENSGVHSITFTNLPAESYEFKITKGASWDTQWGYDDLDFPYDGVSSSGDDGQNIKITLSEAKTITIKFDSSSKKISFDGLTPLIKQNLKYTVTVPKGTTKCYLVGLGDWNNFREMTQDPGNNRIFTLTVNDVYVTDEYKYSASNNWDNAEVDVNNNDVGNRKWSESDVVVKWKNIELVPEALTYTVTVPAGTEECYIAGTMNGWEFAAMEKSITTPNTFTIDIANANEAHEYKYACKQNWDYAEVNADGSSVSNRTYSANDVVAKWGYPTYTVAGDNRIVFGEEWAPAKEDNDMVDQGDGTYKWTKSQIALKKNTEIKFKVVKNHDWEKGSWPGEAWVINTISKDGYYTITITFKESDQSITATATWTGEAPLKDFSNQPATLYFHPSFHWTSDNAEFAAYFYNEGFGADTEPKWADMTDSDGDGVYEVANAKQHEYVIICRMNPSRTENKWDDAVSWNQIESGITIPNTAGDLNTCLAFWTNCQGDVPTSECTWVAPTPLTDKNWADFVTAYKGKTINAVVERSFVYEQLHTLCLPFNVELHWLGDGAKAYKLNSVVGNSAQELSLNASECATMTAGQPYIVKPKKGSEYEHLIVANAAIQDVTAGSYTITGGGYKVTMQGIAATSNPAQQTDGSTEYYIGATTGYLHKDATNKLGLRALVVLTNTDGTAVQGVRARVAFGENVETGIDNIITTDAPIKVIQNGQLIIIREGVKYNVQGQKL